MVTRQTPQQILVEQAKQGEPEAIATLLNHPENKQPFRLQVRRRGSEYRLLAEADQVPDQQATVKWIVQALRKLAIAEMQTVTIYGKSRQSAKPDWQQRFEIGPEVKPEVGQFPSGETPPALAAPTKDLPTSHAEPPLDLSEYCFIRNPALLSVNLTPPSQAVTQTVLSFAALPNAQKLAVLPHIDELLRKLEPAQDDSLAPESQAWITELSALESDNIRKLSIWLSRYCADPAATVALLKPMVAKPEPADSEQRQKPSVSTATNPAVARVMAAQSARAAQLHSPEPFPQSSWLPMWVIPTAWTAGLLLAVTLGISSANSADASFPICKQATDIAQCTLAVQLVSDRRAIAEAMEAAAPLTPKIKTAAAEQCSQYGSTHIISALKLSGLALPSGEGAVSISKSQATELFPGVLLTDITQTDSNANNRTTRIACVGYVSTAPAVDLLEQTGEVSLETTGAIREIAADEIPLTWPEEPYEKFAEMNNSTAKALGVYDLFINFGANTLFTAVGLFVAVLLYACYSCYRLTGIYQMALVLGALETIMHLVPAIGLFMSVPLGVGAIGLASRFIKDFNIVWSDGYKPLARGAVTIVAIKGILAWLLYGAIAHFMA